MPHGHDDATFLRRKAAQLRAIVREVDRDVANRLMELADEMDARAHEIESRPDRRLH
jgi:hypothetical protein